MRYVQNTSITISLLFFLPFVVIAASLPLPPGMQPPPLNPLPPQLQAEEVIDDSIDFALTAVREPQLVVQDKKEGIRIPFTMRSNGTKKYGMTIRLICSDFQAEKYILIEPGVSDQFVFHPLQEAASNRYEGMVDFRAGKKAESCSLSIVAIQHEDFDDLDEPTDSDVTNNGFRFTLTLKNQKPALRDLALDKNNTSERVKKMQQPLSREERNAYATLAKEKCLNILIASEERGFYYNGELIDPEWGDIPGPKIREVHIAGDRLGYMKDNAVIIDGEDVGPLSTIDRQNNSGPDIELKLNQKHYAYFRLVDHDASQYLSTFHLIYDGQDLGPATRLGYKLNGEYVIYDRYTPYDEMRRKGLKSAKAELFVNGKKKANGAFGDYDGKNLAYVAINSHHQVVYNGRKVGYGGDITLKDGHFAFTRGETPDGVNPRIMYDGKNLGRGRSPVIEKKHLAFIRARAEIDRRSKDQHPKVIYDRKELGYVGGFRWKISLAGDHIAYMRRLSDKESPFTHPTGFARINIDGKDYSGDFLDERVYVEIAEKVDRSTCFSL